MRRGCALGERVAAAEQLGAAPLEQLEARGRLEVPGEGDPEGEGAVVADVGVGQELDEPGAAGVGDAVDLLAAAGALDQAALADPGPEGGQLAGERAGHRGAGHRRCAARRPSRSPGPRGGRARGRASRSDGGAAGQQLAEPLLQLVAVELLLREQAEDGEVDHEEVVEALHRNDVSIRCNDRVYDRRTRFVNLRRAVTSVTGHAGPGARAGSLAGDDVPARGAPRRRRQQSAGGVIDYRLARMGVVSEYRKGRLARHEVCDAHPELRRAAKSASEPTEMECPICEDDNIVLVTYAFGARLPASGRCITTKGELAKLAKGRSQLAAYVVEVCPSCSWNHLARTFLLGTG